MKDFVLALHAETLKLKRTLAIWMTLIAPAVIVGLGFLILWQAGGDLGGANPWMSLSRNTLLLWALLMLPLFIALETVLTAHIEHAGNGLKHLFALPVGRMQIYLAKLTVNAFLVLLSYLVLLLLILSMGQVLATLRPDLSTAGGFPAARILSALLFLFLTSLFFVALHTWIAMNWNSVVVGLGVGIAAVVISAVVISSKYNIWYPWSAPATLVGQFIGQSAGSIANAWRAVALPLLAFTGGTLLAAIGGGLLITGKDVT